MFSIVVIIFGAVFQLCVELRKLKKLHIEWLESSNLLECVCMYVALINSATNCLSVCLCVCLHVRTLCLWSRSKSGNCGKNFCCFFLLQREFFLVLGVCVHWSCCCCCC
jgi:hypothetical protein